MSNSPTTTEKDHLAPSHVHHESKVAVQPHSVLETSPPPALHRETTHKSTAHAIIERSTPASLDETSPKSHEDKHPSNHPASSHELHRSTQRRGVSDLEIAAHTEYVDMLLALDKIASYWNILAAFFTWILLAGFVLFPGTFAAWSSSSGTEQKIAGYVQQVPLYIIAWVCTGIGAVGMLWLWWTWHKNYVWLVNRIFIPGLLNSLAGMLSTLANVYGAQQRTFSETSKSSLFITAGVAFICATLFIIYHVILLGALKKRHDREVGEQDAGEHGEGINRRVSERVAKSKGTDSKA